MDGADLSQTPDWAKDKPGESKKDAEDRARADIKKAAPANKTAAKMARNITRDERKGKK